MSLKRMKEKRKEREKEGAKRILTRPGVSFKEEIIFVRRGLLYWNSLVSVDLPFFFFFLNTALFFRLTDLR